MGHLGELRKRIAYAAVAVVVCVIGAFIAHTPIFNILMRPLDNTPIRELTTFGVTEAFMQVLKVSIYAGLIISLPFIMYQFWAFILPGLYENEKRNVIPYMASTTVLFLGGVVFGYFIVLPVGLKFMVNYGGDLFNQLLQAERYISFVTQFLLAFGVVFELPLVMMLLAWTGVLDYVKMRKVRKYAILVEAVVAMVFTPSQDPVSMMLMLLPLIALYEFGIWLSRIVAKRKEKRARLAEIAEDEAAKAEIAKAVAVAATEADPAETGAAEG
jgi:sec-independent protein translocase protein TatC